MNNWTDLHLRSHNRYSNAIQLCVVTGKSGNTYPGVRIENASFPLSISAWQCALFICISQGDEPVAIQLPPNTVHRESLDFWISHYNLSVVQGDALPAEPFATVTFGRPVDIRSELTRLQQFCAIDESKFPVCCLLEVEPDVFVYGVNVELTDWQLGLCAERVAIAKALAYGYTTFHSIHIWAGKGDFISPCGACRQVLVEHMPYERVCLYHPDGSLSEHTPAELLPAFFNGDILDQKR